jgi:putative transposase
LGAWNTRQTQPGKPAKTGAKEIEIERGGTYVFDKGYTDYSWWSARHQAGAYFVTRLKCNVRRREVQPQADAAAGADIILVSKLKLGQKMPRGGAKNALYDTPLLEIVVARAGKTDMHVITNDMTRPAEEIAALYK